MHTFPLPHLFLSPFVLQLGGVTSANHSQKHRVSDNDSPVDDDDLNVFKFFDLFPDEQAAVDYLEAQRWPDGVICPHCNSDYTSPIKNRNRHNCNSCRKQFSVRTGSVFENSKIPLRKWIYAMYVFQTARKGISGAQLARDLGIRQPNVEADASDYVAETVASA